MTNTGECQGGGGGEEAKKKARHGFFSETQSMMHRRSIRQSGRPFVRYCLFKVKGGKEEVRMVTEVLGSFEEGRAHHKRRFADSVYVGVIGDQIRTVYWGET